jgi:hypothetical protein
VAGGGAQAVDRGAPLDHVQVDLQLARLAQRGVEEQCQGNLLELPAERLTAGEEEVLGELLRDRGGSPGGGPAPQVRGDGGRDGGEVDSRVPVESGVLGDEESAHEQGGDLGEVDEIGRLGGHLDLMGPAVPRPGGVDEGALEPFDGAPVA